MAGGCQADLTGNNLAKIKLALIYMEGNTGSNPNVTITLNSWFIRFFLNDDIPNLHV